MTAKEAATTLRKYQAQKRATARVLEQLADTERYWTKILFKQGRYIHELEKHIKKLEQQKKDLLDRILELIGPDSANKAITHD